MTDRIDLDDIAESTDDQRDERNPGDWLWRGDGDPADEPTPPSADEIATTDTDADADAGDDSDAGGGVPADPDDRLAGAVPHVPRQNEDSPVGIPVEGGGAGGGAVRNGASETGDAQTEETATEASGPHGDDADDMTIAFTYGAMTRFADPSVVVAEATQWADWVGIVGDVGVHVVNKFQRDHHVDLDFFNGSGTGPGERLAEIDRRSMFFADRMVVVGVEGEDEDVAREADWEFVSLTTAADEAGWELRE